MSQQTTNFQYVSYLTDFLYTYGDIEINSAKFECSKKNFDSAATALKSYRETFSLVNCLWGWLLIFLCSLISFPLLFIPGVKFLPWISICALFSCVIIVLSKIAYHKRVLPIHTGTLNEELRASKEIYEKSYEILIAHRSNLKRMCEGMDERCSYPLSIYIMREAAKEGCCNNIPQGMRYFNDRYRTLAESTDIEELALKHRIDSEHERSEERQSFLLSLDEYARTLYH